MAGGISNNAETDDFSLEPVPVESRRSWGSLFNALCGMATAMFFMQVGSIMGINYGITNAVIALIYATILGGALGYLISYISAKTGMSSHLLGRSGFGFLGVACFSLIYGANSLMYFSIEGSIMATSVHAYLPSIPLWILMIVIGLFMIPLSWYGIKLMEKFQALTVWIYLLFLVISVVISVSMYNNNQLNWAKYMPENMPFTGDGFLACLAIMNGVIAIMVLNIADFSRFIKPREMKKGNLFVGVFTNVAWFLLAGLFGIWFGVNYTETNPGVYFVGILGLWGVFFAIVTQIRINLGNLYLGSVSFSNFLYQTFKFKLGRAISVVVFSIIATIIMLLNVIHYMEFLVSLSGVFLMSILSGILTDIFIVKKFLKVGPSILEYEPEKLAKVNPVGLLSFILSSIFGLCMMFGLFGEGWVNLAAIVSGILNTVLFILLALITKGKSYYPSREQNIVIEENFETKL
jgi:purine-cytosine permease-like protein